MDGVVNEWDALLGHGEEKHTSLDALRDSKRRMILALLNASHLVGFDSASIPFQHNQMTEGRGYMDNRRSLDESSTVSRRMTKAFTEP